MMQTRKIAAAAGLATGAALAFAPLAAAAPDPTLVTSTLDSEIAYQNSLFETYAALSGNTGDIIKGGAGVFDQIKPDDLSTVAPHLLPGEANFGQVTPLETFLYVTNPIVAGISGNSGPFSEFNGALTQFENAYNVLAYAAVNNGQLDTNINDYIYNSAIAHVLSTPSLETTSSAYQYLLNYGLGDLKGFEALFTPDATSVGDIHPAIASEIGQLNTIFEQDGQLADVYKFIIPDTDSAQGTYINFDTIPTANLNTTFNDLVFGAAGPSTDPGSYDVYNGALTEFYNAFNVADYALVNNGGILPTDLLFGTHDFLGDGVGTAFSEYLNLGFQDLLGYFVPAATTAALG